MERLAYFCVLVFAASAFVLPALANAALIVAAMLLLARPTAAWQRLRGHPLWPVLGLALGYLLLHAALLPTADAPSTANRNALLDLLKLLLLVPVGWAVAGDPRRARALLALAGAGLLLRLLLHAPPGQWLAVFGDPTRRLDFGFTAIASGLYCAAALLGLLLLLPGRVPGTGWTRAATLLGGLLAATLLTAGLLASRSRATWLALLLASPIVLAATGRHGRPALALLGAGVLATVLVGGSAVAHRLGADAAAYPALTRVLGAHDAVAADDAWQQMPYNSLGLRLHVWRAAIEAWWQRPWLGHGAGASEALLAGAANTPLGALSHLHNTYAELALRFGLIGLLLAGAMVATLAAGVVRRGREDRAMDDLVRLLAAVLVLTAVWSASDFRLFRLDFRFYVVLLAGVALGLGLPRRCPPCAS